MYRNINIYNINASQSSEGQTLKRYKTILFRHMVYITCVFTVRNISSLGGKLYDVWVM